MTDRTKHEIDLIDSANKDKSYQQANIKKFNDWLETCPCEYEIVNDVSNLIKFEPLKRK